MDRNSIIGFLLIILIIIGFSIINQPSEEERIKQQEAIAASKQKKKEAESNQNRDPHNKEQSNRKTATYEMTSGDSLQDSLQLADLFGPFAGCATGETEYFIVESDLLKIHFSNKGGRISQVQLTNMRTYDSLPLILFTTDSSYFSVNFFSNNRSINTAELFFEPSIINKKIDRTDNYIKIDKNDSITFSMRLYPEGVNKQNCYLEYLYTIKGGEYMVDFDIRSVGMDPYITRNNAYLNIDWSAQLNRQDMFMKNAKKPSIYYKHLKDDVDHLTESKDSDEKTIGTKVKWIAYKQRFFSSILIAEKSFDNAHLVVENEHPEYENNPKTLNKSDRYLRSMSSQVSIPYDGGPQQDINLHFYFGPNKYNILKKYDSDLEALVPLGWVVFRWINKYAVMLVFNYLEQFNWSYGIIILVLTILLKIVLSPIAYKTYLSQAKMKILKPEIDQLNEKYPKKEDAMKKQQAVMALYKKAGVNPASGCIPMLLQLPILLAMYNFFPAAFELRQQSFLWAHDLSTYDSILNLPFTIPFYGDHVSLFTLLMTISTIIYSKLNSNMMSGGNNQQMPGMKMMIYMMPIMLLFFLNNYASALSYYYLLFNLLTFAQMYLIRQFISDDKIRLQIAQNKKKPVKKSKWQARMEQMAKQQQKK